MKHQWKLVGAAHVRKTVCMRCREDKGLSATCSGVKAPVRRETLASKVQEDLARRFLELGMSADLTVTWSRKKRQLRIQWVGEDPLKSHWLGRFWVRTCQALAVPDDVGFVVG